MQIPLPALAPGDVVRTFQLLLNSKVVYEAMPAQRALRLPASVLCAGCELNWIAEIGTDTYHGTIQVTSARALASLEGEIEAAGTPNEAPDVRALRVSAALQAAGYYWRAQQILSQGFHAPVVPRN